MNNYNPPYKKGISVILCCYNSAVRLPKTLEYLAFQKLPESFLWEIILVDNNSTDNTTETAKSEWKKYNTNVSLITVSEPRQGLSYARRKGVDMASFELLIFCDDDNWLEENFLRYAYEISMANPKIGVLGGRSEGYFEGEKPSWFHHFEGAFAVGNPMAASGKANARRFMAGAGMVIRKSTFDLLEKISFKNVLSDRKGSHLSSGGDSELCWVLVFLGFDLYYDERLRFIHFMPASRLTWKYCVSMISEAHSAPPLYFYLYEYLYYKVLNKQKTSFERAYQRTCKKFVFSSLRKNYRFVKLFYFLKSVFFSTPGSKEEIETKTDLKRIKYLFLHKKQFKKDFYCIAELMQNIKEAETPFNCFGKRI